MATVQEKIARLDAAREKIESLVRAGVDLKSEAAAPLGLELIHGADELGKELGYSLLKPLDEKIDFIHPDPAA